MSDVTTLPTHGEVFLDARGGDRSLRISWHHESEADGVVVLSLWRSGLCVGSFRLRSREVPLLIDALARGLGGSWPMDAEPPVPGPPPRPAPPQMPPQPPPRAAPPQPGAPPVQPVQRAQPAPPSPGLLGPGGPFGPRPGPPPPQQPPQPPPRRLHTAGQQPQDDQEHPEHPQSPEQSGPDYGDVLPKHRYLGGGPPNSSGAESWSA